MIKLPKLHYIASNDKIRPILTKILVTPTEVVATNSLILIVFKREDIFGKLDTFIDAAPARFLIDRNYWKIISEGYIHLIKWKKGMLSFIMSKSKNDTQFEIFVPIQLEGSSVGIYPKYESVFPEKKDTVSEIGLDLILLAKLKNALPSNQYYKLTFSGQSKGIKFEPFGTYKNTVSCKGLIMPVNLTSF